MNTDLLIAFLKANYDSYAKECLKIETKQGKLEPFIFNKCQKRLWQMVKQDLLNKKPVRYIILKARQLGISTFIQGLAHWFTNLNKHRGAIVIAQDDDAVENLFHKQDVFYQNLPDYLKPMIRISNKKELHFANPSRTSPNQGLESRIITQSAKKSEIGRSFTLHLAHLSEFAFWENLGYNPNSRLLALNQAIPEDPGTFVFIESTACGDGIFKEMWEDESSIYTKLFISWVADDNYRLEIDPFDYFQLYDSEESPFGDEKQEWGYIKEQLAIWQPELKGQELLHEIYCRLNWRRHTITHKCLKKVEMFQQEYPTIPEQAFIATGANLFDLRILQKMKESVSQAYNFRYCDDVEDRILSFLNNRNTLRDICLEAFEETQLGELEIFEPPKENTKYCIGADVAEGVIGGDYSSAVVLRLPNLVEVATYNKIVSPDEFSFILYCLGHIYNNALIGVEDNEKGGFTVIRQLQMKLFYNNLYRRQVFDTTEGYKEVDKLGWRTTSKTKPLMIGELDEIISNKAIKFNSLKTIKQLMLYRVFPDGKTGVARPNYDDLAVAAMISYQMSKTIKVKLEYQKENKPLTMKDFENMIIENQRKNSTYRGLYK